MRFDAVVERGSYLPGRLPSVADHDANGWLTVVHESSHRDCFNNTIWGYSYIRVKDLLVDYPGIDWLPKLERSYRSAWKAIEGLAVLMEYLAQVSRPVPEDAILGWASELPKDYSDAVAPYYRALVHFLDQGDFATAGFLAVAAAENALDSPLLEKRIGPSDSYVSVFNALLENDIQFALAKELLLVSDTALLGSENLEGLVHSGPEPGRSIREGVSRAKIRLARGLGPRRMHGDIEICRLKNIFDRQLEYQYPNVKARQWLPYTEGGAFTVDFRRVLRFDDQQDEESLSFEEPMELREHIRESLNQEGTLGIGLSTAEAGDRLFVSPLRLHAQPLDRAPRYARWQSAATGISAISLDQVASWESVLDETRCFWLLRLFIDDALDVYLPKPLETSRLPVVLFESSWSSVFAAVVFERHPDAEWSAYRLAGTPGSAAEYIDCVSVDTERFRLLFLSHGFIAGNVSAGQHVSLSVPATVTLKDINEAEDVAMQAFAALHRLSVQTDPD